ncbi:MAG: hypothetical protein WBB85_17190, partial [Albidovulum sp.]|uniref:hypothetical protein n=1 Tax=Albidovulum sp. TaxID=1872424 RepID=UPI003C9B9B4F
MRRVLLPLAGTAGLLLILTAQGALLLRSDDRVEEGVDLQRVAEEPATAENAVAHPLPSARPDIYYAAITERPLFSPTRRPQSSESEPEKAEPVEDIAAESQDTGRDAPAIRLLGIMSGTGTPSALIAAEDGVSEWHKAGASLGT